MVSFSKTKKTIFFLFLVSQVPPLSASIKSEIISSGSSASAAYQQQHSSNSNNSGHNLKINGFEPYNSNKSARASIANNTRSPQITNSSEPSPR